MYIWRGNLISFVKHFYKGLCLHKTKSSKTFNLRVDWTQIERFALGIKISLGLHTYDETRRVFAKALSQNDDMVLPARGEFEEFILRAFSLGIGNMVGREVGNIMITFNLVVPHMETLGFSDPNEFSTHPIYIGITNRLRQLSLTLKGMKNISLAELADQLTIVDIDQVFSKERRQVLPLYKGGIILSNGLRELSEMDEVYYGGSTTDSTWDTPFGLSEVHASTIDLAERDMVTALEGNYKPAPTQASVEDA